MISEKQLDANRRNAQASSGPTTEEGKRRSSQNALRHGLTGQVTAMTEEDRTAHDKFCAAMLKDLAPDGAVETQLAQRVATDSWRLNRISAVEDNLFALGFHAYVDKVDTEHPEIDAAFAAAKTFQAEAKQFQLLTLYEQRLNRAVHKNLAALQELQAKRKAEREAAMEQAKKLCQLYQSKPGSYANPTTCEVNGFVFSNEELRRAIDRDRHLQRAEHLEFRRHKHQKQQALAA